MQLCTDTEIERIGIGGGGRSSPFYMALLALQPGQGLIISFAEWHKKYPPTRMAASISKKYNRRIQAGRLANGQGWGFMQVL